MNKKTSRKHIAQVRDAVWQHKLLIVLAGLALGVLFIVPTIYANIATRSQRYHMVDLQQVPRHGVAVVFGAGVNKDGSLTPYLQWRVEAGAALYKAGTVKKLLMSGDNSTRHYNEPVAMGKYAEKLGVPARDVVLDYAGFSTYDTCYRAHAIFGLDNAVLVSQGYHLSRAIMTCDALGVRSIGLAAGHTFRDWTVPYLAREDVATVRVMMQLIYRPKPVFLGQTEPIQL
jgi:vancomycin permeability regulator SanA